MAEYIFMMVFFVVFLLVLATGTAALAGPRTGIAAGVIMISVSGLYFSSLGALPWQEAPAQKYQAIAQLDSGPDIAKQIDAAKKDGKITNWEIRSIRDALDAQDHNTTRDRAFKAS